MRLLRVIVLLNIIIFLAATLPANAQMETATVDLIKKVGFDQHLDAQLPLDMPFIDESGTRVMLRDYFNNTPVILLFGYYTCKNLCSTVLESLIGTMNNISLHSGADYQIVSISIDPANTPADALKRKSRFATRYTGVNRKQDWHFLTGREANIRRVADTAGFRYTYDPKNQEYLHASGIMIVTAEGKIAKYFYGVGYRARDVRLGLVDASHGKVGTPVDQLLLRCFHYDPSTGEYSLMIVDTLRLMGIITIIIIAGIVIVLLLHERRRSIRETLG